MADGHVRKWTPIEDLPNNWRKELNNVQTQTMVQAWQEQAQELRQQELYQDFITRLRRQWAIETGVIEGLYDLSEGATIALIEKGLDASLVSHSDTNEAPELVVARIKDQHDAIMGLYQFVSGERPLGTSYIRELHQTLTRHQDTYEGRDTLGNWVTRRLPKGTYKNLSNNVEHPDGTSFEYCPPEHVDAEIENLVTMHTRHQEQIVPPHIESAWLHHRFSLIHPFVDGNGRVARCLATLVLLKANWLPLVITRRDRTTYIASLRSADDGNLLPLVELIGNLQRKAVREALSLSEEVLEESTQVSSILDEVKARLENRHTAEAEERQRAITTADSLQHFATERLREIADKVQETIQAESPSYWAKMREGRRNTSEAKYNYYQIIQCAKKIGYFANLPTYQAWSALVISTGERSEILFSFHGIGYEDSGILGCSAMFYAKESLDSGENIVREVTPLADAPFEFNYLDDETEVRKLFQGWLESCVIKGLDNWKKFV